MSIPLWIRADPIKLVIVFSPIRKPPSYLANIGTLSTSQEFTFIYTFYRCACMQVQIRQADMHT